MKVLHVVPGAPAPWAASSVVVGNLDGVHRGHQALVTAARARRSTAPDSVLCALTFDPHPSRVLGPERSVPALMTIEQKAEVLASLGVDRLAVLAFTEELSRIEPADFVRDVLERTLRASTVVVGADFRFGRGRLGDVAHLRQLGGAAGFVVEEVAPVMHEGAPVSSSRIREALARGAVDNAAALLGRSHFLDGRVVRGDGRGRTIGVPTANLEVVNESLLRGGVYAGFCRVGDDPTDRPAVMNLGRRPTFPGAGPTVEAHLLDFEDDLYDRVLRVSFVERLRDEQAFAGVAALVAQIRSDVAAARARLLRHAANRI